MLLTKQKRSANGYTKTESIMTELIIANLLLAIVE